MGKGLEPVKTKKENGIKSTEEGRRLKKENERNIEEGDGDEEKNERTQTSEATLEK